MPGLALSTAAWLVLLIAADLLVVADHPAPLGAPRTRRFARVVAVDLVALVILDVWVLGQRAVKPAVLLCVANAMLVCATRRRARALARGQEQALRRR